MWLLPFISLLLQDLATCGFLMFFPSGVISGADFQLNQIDDDCDGWMAYLRTLLFLCFVSRIGIAEISAVCFHSFPNKLDTSSVGFLGSIAATMGTNVV